MKYNNSIEYWYSWHRSYESRYGISFTRKWSFPEEEDQKKCPNKITTNINAQIEERQYEIMSE